MTITELADRPARPQGQPGESAQRESREWNDIATLTWEGHPVDCSQCPYAELQRQGKCEPGRACMNDAYARRIDRFFSLHPERANDHLTHGYFEVRAIAARYADVFRLPPLIGDPDETVRMQLALRLPQRHLLCLRRDPHREVRIRVAQRLDPHQLAAMAKDSDYQVRATVARRLPVTALGLLIGDRDTVVRREVAARLEMPDLQRMVGDTSAEVRRIVAERLPPELLHGLVDDADLLVRHLVAGRACGQTLQRLLLDREDDIRLRAQERLDEVNDSAEAVVAPPCDSPLTTPEEFNRG